jgi:hypothetical protein
MNSHVLRIFRFIIFCFVLKSIVVAGQDLSRGGVLAQRTEIAQSEGQSRLLQGQVTNGTGEAIPEAVVYLKNTRSQAIKTYIAGKDGDFRFPELPQNADFQLWAEFNGAKSPAKTMSAFDDRREITINLRIDPKK